MVQAYVRDLPPRVTYLVTSNGRAVRAVLNPRSKGSRESALKFHRSLTDFFAMHGQTMLVLVWSPTDHSLGPRQRVRRVVAATIRAMTTEDEMTPPETLLRQDTRQAAFDKWSAEWVANPPPMRPPCRPSPSPSLPPPTTPFGSRRSRSPLSPRCLVMVPPPSFLRLGFPAALCTHGTPLQPQPASWWRLPSPGIIRRGFIPPFRNFMMAALAAPPSGLSLTSCTSVVALLRPDARVGSSRAADAAVLLAAFSTGLALPFWTSSRPRAWHSNPRWALTLTPPSTLDE